jgi:hypothetical protein
MRCARGFSTDACQARSARNRRPAGQKSGVLRLPLCLATAMRRAYIPGLWAAILPPQEHRSEQCGESQHGSRSTRFKATFRHSFQANHNPRHNLRQRSLRKLNCRQEDRHRRADGQAGLPFTGSAAARRRGRPGAASGPAHGCFGREPAAQGRAGGLAHRGAGVYPAKPRQLVDRVRRLRGCSDYVRPTHPRRLRGYAWGTRRVFL